jgi:peptidoglycan/LPS O-acetylase OafA/YrhL
MTVERGPCRLVGRPDARSDYLPWLDALRAIAVLSVVGYHLEAEWLPGGLLGVDMFFVISGFVVCAASAAAPSTGLSGSAVWFYTRRLRRLAPALVLCLLVTALVSALLVPPTELADDARRVGLAAFFGLGNWQLARAGSDYFAVSTEFNPYAHTWSLGVEEQFYLLFPLFIAAWHGHRAGARQVAAWLLTLGAGSLVLAWWWAGSGQQLAGFYLLPTRLWELATGVLLYLVLAKRQHLAESLRAVRLRAALVAACVLLLAAALLLARPIRMPWPDALPAVVATAALIALLYRREAGLPGRWLQHPWLSATGRMSYSIYLWHWPVFVLLRWTVGFDSAATRLIGLLLALALAVASYRWIERPLRHAAWFPGRSPAAVLGLGLVGVLAAAALFHGIHQATPALTLSVVGRHAEDWRPEAVAAPGEAVCAVRREVQAVEPLRIWHFDGSGCVADSDAGARLFVLGDSHALGYVSQIRRLLATRGGEAWLYHRPGCAVVDPLANGDLDDSACHAASEMALRDIAARMRAGDRLFLPSLRIPRLSEPWRVLDRQQALDAVHSAGAAQQRERAQAAAIARLRPLAEAGLQIVLEAPKPVLPSPPFRCADPHTRSNPICAGGLSIERETLQALRQPALTSLQAIAAALPEARVWDPFLILCPGQRCSAWLDGRPLFFDGDHPSGHGNRLLYPAFAAEVAGEPGSPPP